MQIYTQDVFKELYRSSEERYPVALSIVVPIYNEAGNVAQLHERINTVCKQLGEPYEIIFVDDGSTDGTGEICRTLSPLTLISFRRNFGQTAAFDAGIKQARGAVVITLDGDLQNDPADIPRLLQKLAEGYDVVSGWRYNRHDSLSKKITSRTANLLRKFFFGDSIHDSGCALKAYRRECFKNLDLFGEMHRFIPALLESRGFRVGEIKVKHYPRVNGKSKYGNVVRGVKGLVDMVSVWFWDRFSSRPVHLFGSSGILLGLVGSMILTWMFVQKVIFGIPLSEKIWPLMGVFFVLTGIQFFTFGILADILVKSYYKGQRRMNYFIKEVVSRN